MSSASATKEFTTLFESLGLHDNSDKVFLNAGAPGPDSLRECANIMRKATEHRLASGDDSYVMQYGPEAGEVKYLAEVAKFLTEQYGNQVDRNSLIGTAGASQGLHLTMSMLYSQERPVIFVEELTYHLAAGMLRPFADGELVPVPFQTNGVDLMAFEKLLIEKRPPCWQTREHPWALLYAIPTYHNPTGRCYSDEVCVGVVKLARKYRVLVLCDDVYNCLYYSSDRGQFSRLFGFDTKSDPDYCGSVISNGSFSKILSPGLRVGWMEVPQWFRKLWMSCGIIVSGGGVNNYTQAIVAATLELGLTRDFLGELRSIYSERASAVMQVLREELPAGCSFEQIKGGYFLWIQLREDMDAGCVLTECLQNHGISAFQGTKFYFPEKACEKYGNCIRISISYYDKEILIQSMKKLCSVVKQLLQPGSV